MSVSLVLFTNDTEHFLICLLAVCVSAPGKCFKVSFVIFSNFMCFFLLISRNSFYIFETNYMCIANILSPFYFTLHFLEDIF